MQPWKTNKGNLLTISPRELYLHIDRLEKEDLKACICYLFGALQTERQYVHYLKRVVQN